MEILKTKTKSILDKITKPQYTRKPEEELLYATKNETKTIIIARYGMLECGRNYKGTMNMICTDCQTIDDENHRINYCKKWETVNYAKCNDKKDFNNIYSNDIARIREIVPVIESLWNTKNANGTMNIN